MVLLVIITIENSENDDTEMYESLAQLASSDTDRTAIRAVLHDEEMHGGAMQRISDSILIGPQAMLDTILHRERWHRCGGGWIGQAIHGSNDGLGSVFGIVSGVAGATAGGSAVLIAGLAGMLASALSMGSGAYLATEADREILRLKFDASDKNCSKTRRGTRRTSAILSTQRCAGR